MSEATPQAPTLYGYFRSSAAYRVRIAMHWKAIPFVQQPVNLLEGEQRHPDYQTINPQGLVPALRLPAGTLLTQSLAICEYLEETVPEPPLLPRDPAARAEARALANAIACDVHPLANLRVQRHLKAPLGHNDEAVGAWIRHWIGLGFEALEATVAPGQPYLAGDAVSLADVCLVPQHYNARRFEVDLGPFPKLTAIVARLTALPAFAAAHPDRQPDAPQAG